MKTFAFGGGRQSVSVLVLAAQGDRRFIYDAYLFSNVGENSEYPDTLIYFREIVMPFAKHHGLNVIELTGKKSIRDRIMTTERSQVIPVHLSGGNFGRRSCTVDFKIRRMAAWQKRNGATAENPAIHGLGISLNEWWRAKSHSGFAWQKLEYPLIEARLKLTDCISIISNAGLPIPPRSACYFCPFHGPVEWLELKRNKPDLFDDAVQIEKRINGKKLDQQPVYLHPSRVPLDQAVGDQIPMPFWDEMSVCESGYCFI
jgi:hypothetical protein